MRLRKRGLMFPGESLKDFDDSRLGDFLYFLRDADARFVEFQNTCQVDWSRDQDDLAGSPVDGLFEFMLLDRTVAHGREQVV